MTTVIVELDHIISDGESYVFQAGGWEILKNGDLVVHCEHGCDVAHFAAHRWGRVYYEDHLIDVRGSKR